MVPRSLISLCPITNGDYIVAMDITNSSTFGWILYLHMGLIFFLYFNHLKFNIMYYVIH